MSKNKSSTSTIKEIPIHFQHIEMPIEILKLAPDVPNFKENADPATGVVKGQGLKGKFQRLGTAPIVVWARKNGEHAVITGRHRLDLARNSGETTISSHVVREGDGFTQAMAVVFDSESNIRDGQGSLRDYAHFFRNSQIDKSEAEVRGLLSRTKGQDAWVIAKEATQETYDLWRNERISAAQAVAIGSAAPGNDAYQSVGRRFAIQRQPACLIFEALMLLRRCGTGLVEERSQGELFVKDHIVEDFALRVAELAKSKRTELSRELKSFEGPANHPGLAKKNRVTVKGAKSLLVKASKIKAEIDALGSFWKHTELCNELVAEVRAQSVAAPDSMTVTE